MCYRDRKSLHQPQKLMCPCSKVLRTSACVLATWIAMFSKNDHVRQFLQCCAEKQIALNPQKCTLCISEVIFTGFRLSAEGYQVGQSITKAICQFLKPTNHTELHSFVGLVNQLSSSINTVATILTLLKPLLSTKNDFLWNDNHDKAFAASMDALTTALVISFFDAKGPLPYVLMHTGKDLVSSYNR